MAAPGPGRDFEGCPKFCGAIVLVTAGYAAAWLVTLRLIGKRIQRGGS